LTVYFCFSFYLALQK